jgi:hypothetical protein
MQDRQLLPVGRRVRYSQQDFGMNVPSFPTRHLARLTFVAFLLTFIAARTLVILIMTRKVPDLFLHLGAHTCITLTMAFFF